MQWSKALVLKNNQLVIMNKNNKNYIDLGDKDPKYMTIVETAVYNRKLARIRNLGHLKEWIKTNNLHYYIKTQKNMAQNDTS